MAATHHHHHYNDQYSLCSTDKPIADAKRAPPNNGRLLSWTGLRLVVVVVAAVALRSICFNLMRQQISQSLWMRLSSSFSRFEFTRDAEEEAKWAACWLSTG